MKSKPFERTFGRIVDEAVDAAHELRRLEANNKLTPAAFLEQALQVASCDALRLHAIEEQLASVVAPVREVHAFIRQMAKAVRERNFPAVPVKKMGKLVNAYGSPGTMAELADCRITVSEAFAVAVRRCVQDHPDDFGPVEDPVEYIAKVETLRDKLKLAYDEMRVTYTASDLITDSSDLSVEERRRGFVVQRFKVAPSVHLGQDFWPQHVVEAVLARAAVGDPKVQQGIEDDELRKELSTDAKGRPRRKVISARSEARLEREEAST